MLEMPTASGNLWDGCHLGGPLALFTPPGVAHDRGLTSVVVLSEGGGPVVVGTGQLGGFFDMHPAAVFVSEDVARLHWHVLAACDRSEGPDRLRQAVWGLSREGRWGGRPPAGP